MTIIVTNDSKNGIWHRTQTNINCVRICQSMGVRVCVCILVHEPTDDDNCIVFITAFGFYYLQTFKIIKINKNIILNNEKLESQQLEK